MAPERETDIFADYVAPGEQGWKVVEGFGGRLEVVGLKTRQAEYDAPHWFRTEEQARRFAVGANEFQREQCAALSRALEYDRRVR